MNEEKITTLPSGQIERAGINALALKGLIKAVAKLDGKDFTKFKTHELATILKTLRTFKEAAKEIKSASEHLYDILSINILPDRMEEEGLELLAGDDFRLEIRNQVRVSCLKKDREALHTWYKENDMGDLVSETVNSSSLKSAVKNAMEDGTPFPAHLLKIEPYKQAVIVKR